jgi:CHRD domain
MRNALLVSVLAPVLVVAACSDSPTTVLPVYSDLAMGVAANGGRNATASLAGANEIPPRDTRARGNAIFHLDADGSELRYKLIVANIENVVQAHIHLGAPDANGPIVVFLYGLVPPGGGRVNGVLAEGVITAADFIGPLAGMTMDDLIEAMQSDGAYVNVHTNDGVAPMNTGPGDFPGGEVRGQVK